MVLAAEQVGKLVLGRLSAIVVLNMGSAVVKLCIAAQSLVVRRNMAPAILR